MNDDQKALLDLMIDRFERLEKQNDEQLSLLRDHIEKDNGYYRKVDQHESFFKVVGVVLFGFLGAIGAWFAATLGLHK